MMVHLVIHLKVNKGGAQKGRFNKMGPILQQSGVVISSVVLEQDVFPHQSLKKVKCEASCSCSLAIKLWLSFRSSKKQKLWSWSVNAARTMDARFSLYIKDCIDDNKS